MFHTSGTICHCHIHNLGTPIWESNPKYPNPDPISCFNRLYLHAILAFPNPFQHPVWPPPVRCSIFVGPRHRMSLFADHQGLQSAIRLKGDDWCTDRKCGGGRFSAPLEQRNRGTTLPIISFYSSVTDVQVLPPENILRHPCSLLQIIKCRGTAITFFFTRSKMVFLCTCVVIK